MLTTGFKLWFVSCAAALSAAVFAGYTSGGTETGPISLGWKGGVGDHVTYVRVRFEDEGPGIPTEVLPRLFIPFYTRRAGGTGLGLALCRRFVHAHGGEIDLGMRPGGGARFTVLLPLEAPERPPRLAGPAGGP